jgi:hypothetical protein
MSKDITFLNDKDVNWSFGDKGPYYNITVGNWPKTEYIDPFPCYSHDETLVKSEVARINSIVKLPHSPKYFILAHEALDRTNGCACDNQQWADNSQDKNHPAPIIILYGKRIPIMPSMTRYLISHEVGHVVEYNLWHLMDLDSNEFREMYAKIRGIKLDYSYGARNWHKNIGEIFANDVRIILFERETEFWPHECKHPMLETGISNWLAEQYAKYFMGQSEFKLQ